MKLSDQASIPAQVMGRQVGAEAVILDLARGTYYGLDAVGARIWQLITEGKTFDAICDVLVNEFETTRETLAVDVIALARQLAAKGLLGSA
ncbi:MAG: PqqD family protein [Candidatus Accumulibacter sp.]|jgi:hypothetical protein|uniref:PqqD family protein n=1 Tax=Candidatus Accumulibacter affinis TaxID=2954384 RepID=A0A935T8A9_9PROT|nr:PqqD family protein [Candidatus Accumulibacter affinis]